MAISIVFTDVQIQGCMFWEQLVRDKAGAWERMGGEERKCGGEMHCGSCGTGFEITRLAAAASDRRVHPCSCLWFD